MNIPATHPHSLDCQREKFSNTTFYKSITREEIVETIHVLKKGKAGVYDSIVKFYSNDMLMPRYVKLFKTFFVSLVLT